MARPRITLMAFVSNSFAMRAVPPIGCGSQPTGDLLPHIPRSGGSGGEKGEAGREAAEEVEGPDRAHIPRGGGKGGEKGGAGRKAVEKVGGPDRAQPPGPEAPRQGERAEQLVDDP